jgi:hypothetical protein
MACFYLTPYEQGCAYIFTTHKMTGELQFNFIASQTDAVLSFKWNPGRAQSRETQWRHLSPTIFMFLGLKRENWQWNSLYSTMYNPFVTFSLNKEKRLLSMTTLYPVSQCPLPSIRYEKSATAFSSWCKHCVPSTHIAPTGHQAQWLCMYVVPRQLRMDGTDISWKLIVVHLHKKFPTFIKTVFTEIHQYDVVSSKLVQPVTPSICTMKVRGSNLGREGYHVWEFNWIFSLPPCECKNSIL